MSNSGPRWFVECTKTIVVLDNRRRVPSLLSSPLSPSEWFGNHFHRDHRYPGPRNLGVQGAKPPCLCGWVGSSSLQPKRRRQCITDAGQVVSAPYLPFRQLLRGRATIAAALETTSISGSVAHRFSRGAIRFDWVSPFPAWRWSSSWITRPPRSDGAANPAVPAVLRRPSRT
jgi:hypothetical protein